MNPPDVAVAVDLSVWELFKNAHLVVKLVMIGLLAVGVELGDHPRKILPVRQDAQRDRQVRAGVLVGQSLEELYQALSQRRNTGMAALFVAAMRGTQHRAQSETDSGTQLRVEKVMDVTISREVERLERGSPSSPPSARPRRSSDCSARCGAS